MSSSSSIKGIEKKVKLDGSKLHVVVIHTEWNQPVVGPLVTGCVDTLRANGCEQVDIVVVPGAFELPFACQRLIKQDPTIDAVVAIGCLIKGDTMHFEYICESLYSVLVWFLDTTTMVLNGPLQRLPWLN
ncbi:6,7-dimethyl-8-ribityllumazine synthase [Batrachochytrium salamandrivorans]|nr:6,7-dimethyl-8-ribityllumazine synthase [Batrachochytrium salamandrivorans]